MADINFVDQVTVVPAAWLQDVDDVVYRMLGASAGPGGSAPASRSEIVANLGAAPAAGNAAQTFAVANAAATNQAVNWGQAGTQLLIPATSSTITPVAFNTLVFPNFSSAGTITVNPGAVSCQRVRVYGGAYPVTVQTNVTSGSPYLFFPDAGQSYTWVGNGFNQFIDMVWDGANWRCTTAGQTVVATATASNQAVNLGQFLGPLTNGVILGMLAASTTYTCSVSFTAPSAGYVWGQSRLILSSTATSGIQNSLLINGTQYQSDSTAMPMTECGVVQVSQGQSVTVTAEAITGSTAPGVGASLHVDAIFIPALQN